MGINLITINNVSRVFGNLLAVENIHFSIKDGETVVILGPNGAGKTTTLRLLSTLIKPTTGYIEYDNYHVWDYKEADNLVRCSIGFMSENSGLYEGLSVNDNLLFFGSLYGIDKKYLSDRITELSTIMGINGVMNIAVKKLSKGTKQRVAFARALLHNPKYLLLDEPTSGLDPISANMVKSILMDLRSKGKTIIITTHNLAEATYLATRIILLNKRVMADGTIGELYKYFNKNRMVRIVYSGGNGSIVTLLNKFDFVEDVKQVNKEELIITVKGGMENNWQIVKALTDNNIKLYLMDHYGNDLEKIYISAFGGNNNGH